MRLSLASLPVVCAAFLFAGCATQETGRARLVVPSEIGAVYSEAELQAQLALTPDARCVSAGCAALGSFRTRVFRLAARLDAAAGALAADLGLAAPRFAVSVPGKDDIGTLSSASGSIIVFDGAQTLELSDPALAFVIAREMGHILGRHHEENTANGLAVSVAVAILFPVAGILQGVEAAYAASTLATTATSFAGARVVRAFYREDQQREADMHALLILTRAGWTPHDVAHALDEAAPRLEGEGWLVELRASRRWLDAIVSGPVPEAAAISPPAAAVEMAPDSFGPVYDAGALWIAGLLHGAYGIDRLCGVRLPSPVTQPGQTARSPVTKKASKAKKRKLTAKKKKRAGRTVKQRVRR